MTQEELREIETYLDGIGYDLAELKIIELQIDQKRKWIEEIITRNKK